MSLKSRILDDVKQAMRAGDGQRRDLLRMLTAAIKQREVDERIELEDADVLAITEKLIKQRREAADQFTKGGRPELADKELAEASVLEAYLPPRMDEAELGALIDELIESTGASSAKDMGKVMGPLKAKVQGRADMSQASRMVKARLA